MSLVKNLLNHPEKLSFYSVSYDGDGDITRTLVYDSVDCRWEENITVVVDSTGKEVVAKIGVWILPEYTIQENYEVIKGSETYKILTVSPKYGLGGIKDHTKLYLK